jgi:hypothetical protein
MRAIHTVAVVVVLVAAVASVASAEWSQLDEDIIRCKVCERAIGYVWNQGEKLRRHCKSPERNDTRCDLSNVHHFGIDEMVHQVCDKLPHTHKAVQGSEFDLVLHDDPQHPDHVIEAITNTCVKWVHEDHGLDHVALYIFANLDAGKSTHTILHSLQHRFCKKACNKWHRRDDGHVSRSWSPSKSQSMQPDL